MKKLIALLMILALCLPAAWAAEWAEGRSAAQPYAGVPEVNLEETMGYIMLYPRAKLPAERFCDILEIYLPREDIVLGEGSLTLNGAEGEIARVSFADADLVEVRPLEESELDGLLWGGGVCIEIHLPVSLDLGGSYYVLMEAGCFSAAGGKVQSLPITSPEAWAPVLNGDYGISGLFYSAPVEVAAPDELDEEVPEPELGEPKAVAEVGDVITFNLVMGGDAKYAVLYSENDSAWFETLEYTESCTVTGTVIGEDLDWGVAFLDENGDLLDVVDLS